MVNNVMSRTTSFVDWISDGYRPAPRAFAVLRICFAAYVLIWPRDITWIGRMSEVAYAPPPGPFALIPGPVPDGVILALASLRAIVALWVLIGWKTKAASATLSAVLIICSGLAYSFGKVDHLILYDLAPVMLGFAGWGAVWSVDAVRHKAAAVSGYVMLVYGIVIAFALATACALKAATGWLNPERQATRFFVASDLEYAVTKAGPFAHWVLQFDSAIFWKFIDYATLFAEGWLLIAVFFPGLFRIGLILLSLFHVGVWLTMGIDYHLYGFVYVGFLLVPLNKWFPEAGAIRRRVKRKRTQAATLAN